MAVADTTLPTDIIAGEILPRLLAKSLLRFKCVCKFFKTLITSSDFINLHLRFRYNSNSNSLVTLTKDNKGEHRLFFFDIDTPDSNAVQIPLPRPFEDLNRKVYTVGSCNGLLCLGTSVYDSAIDRTAIMLVNPFTGIYQPISFCYEPGSLPPRNLGFGYDPETDDYKIALMRYSFDLTNSNDLSESAIKRDVMVYSLKANTWRLVDKERSPPPSYGDFYRPTMGALVDNHLLHWIFFFSSDPKHQIRCFNLRTEQWGSNLLFPNYQDKDAAASSSKLIFNLGVLDGCLCLSIHEKDESPVIDVWIMKEYGVNESWMKLCSHNDLGIPLSRHPNEGISLVVLMWLENNVKDKGNKAEIRGLIGSSVNAYICSGSLVDLAGGKSVWDLEHGRNDD